jgi:O-antigen/teichoic acid export membrane protein
VLCFHSQPNEPEKFPMIAWLQRNRTSVRLAFLLRLFSMTVGALLSLLWYRLLLRAMGDSLYGLFLSFLAVSRLGGVGDFGISGAVGIKAGMMLGRGENEPLRKLLASARSLFFLLAALNLVGFTALSPWLPHWLHFQTVPGAGPLPLLFVWAGVTGAVTILAGYFHNLNYAHGTVTWPILPGVVIGQLLAPLLHWQLARMQEPLWVQNLPYVAATLFGSWFAWQMLKWSHAWLGEWRPLRFDRALWKILLGTSFWVYLCSVCNAIYFSTDCLVINAGFGPALVPMYQANYKPCALVVTLILSASFVSLPKITQRISSPHPAGRERVGREAGRLNIFQILLGCGAALAYLALNNWFIQFWLGAKYQCPLAWQIAFACNLAVTTGGDAGIQIASRCGDSGIKKIGLVAGVTAFINLALSLVAMKLGSITGIAVATVIAQSMLSITLGYVTCRYVGFSVIRWTLKSWLLPLSVVLAAAALKTMFPEQSWLHLGALLGCYAGLLLLTAWLAGVNREMLRAEIAVLRAALKI